MATARNFTNRVCDFWFCCSAGWVQFCTPRSPLRSARSVSAASRWRPPSIMSRLVLLSSLLWWAAESQTCPSGGELYFSQYNEASSGSNKYLQIYNPTSASIALSGYFIGMCGNGCPSTVTSASTTDGFESTGSSGIFTFAGGATIAAGGTYTVCNSGLVDTSGCDETSTGTIMSFNGDDFRALCRGTTSSYTIVDQVGTGQTADVGSSWTVCGSSSGLRTADGLLTRQTNLCCSPNSDGSATDAEYDAGFSGTCSWASYGAQATSVTLWTYTGSSCGTSSSSSSSTPSAGSCAVIGYNSDTSESFAILLLDTLPSGTQITATDNGWTGSAFRTGEGTMTYTAASDIAAGNVLHSSEWAGSMLGLSASDQLLIYSGTASSPTFLCAYMDSTSWTTGTVSTTSQSQVPNGLTDGTNALAQSADNAAYNKAVVSGTAAELRTAIYTTSNWETSSSTTFDLTTRFTDSTFTVSSGASGDPHISFANGGHADFRGAHRKNFAFVSAPGFQFAPFFQEVDFWYWSPLGLSQLIHGTFMTQLMWRVRTAAGRELLIAADSMKKGELTVMNVPGPTDLALGGNPRVENVALGPWQKLSVDDVRIETRMLTVCVETPSWSVNATSRPIYNLVPPLINDTHVHGHWEEQQRRFDIVVDGDFPQPEAHGIIGQSYHDATVRNGRLDVYGIDEFGADRRPNDTSSDGLLPSMTTSAQAEGAIDGVYTDYQLASPFSTTFEYSRYHRDAPPPMSRRSKRTSKTNEWEPGNTAWVGKTRE